MSEVNILSTAIRRFEALREEQAAQKERLAVLTAQVGEAETEIIRQLLDLAEAMGAGSARVTVDGRNYSVSEATYYRIPKAARDTAFPALRQLGMGYLIQEKVDDRTLTRELALRAEEHGGQLPEEYEALGLESYSRPKLMNRKA